MVGSFVLMLPAVIGRMEPARLKAMYVGAIALLLAAQAVMPWMLGGMWEIAAFLLLFFTAFNALEAHLPTLVSRAAPGGSRGVAIGVFTSLQFFGTFFGAAVGGFLYGRWNTAGVVIFSVVLLVIWLAAATGTRIAPARESGQRGN
jgi:predicted MFS family arabinose efflux permease